MCIRDRSNPPKPIRSELNLFQVQSGILVDNARSHSTSYSLDRQPRSRVINDKPAIAVLGPIEGEAEEVVAAQVAGALASGGYAVIVSGKGRVAASAARAASAQGGEVVLVLEEKESASTEPLNNQTRVSRPSILQCTEAILDHADALLVLPGDLQALAALMQVWAYGTTEDGPYRPLVLLGDEWPRLVKALATAANLDRKQRAMVTFASAPDEAVESLRYYIST